MKANPLSSDPYDPTASPAITAVVRFAVIAATLVFFAGAMVKAALGARDVAVVLALAAPLGISALGFMRAGHNEAAVALLCCVLVTVVTLILVLSPLAVHDMAITAYAGVIALGALLHARRHFMMIVGLTVFAATAVFAYDLGGYPRSVASLHSVWPQYASFLVVAAGLAFFVRMLAEQLFSALADLDAAARTDSVTGLLNRAGFLAAASQRLRAVQSRAEGAALVVADLDGLRRMNLVVGYQAADALLAEAARRLQAECAGDLVGRIGDDEFAVLRTGLHESHVQPFALVVHAALAFEHRGVSVRNAAGYARCPRDANGIESLMMSAESGLAHAKDRETDRVAGPADRI